LTVADAPGSSVTSRVRLVPLTVNPSPLIRGKIVESAYRSATVPVSSVPSADGVVAIGDVAVRVVVTGASPVFVKVRSVTATSLSVMNFFSPTDRPARV
jgi:hypothetical protein